MCCTEKEKKKQTLVGPRLMCFSASLTQMETVHHVPSLKKVVEWQIPHPDVTSGKGQFVFPP